MTLAILLLLLSVFWTMPAVRPTATPHSMVSHSESADAHAQAASTQTPGEAVPAQNSPTPAAPPAAAASSATPPKKPSSNPAPHKAHKTRSKKTAASSDCGVAQAPNGQPTSSSGSPGSGSPGSGSTNPASSASSTSTNCPPAKIIVQQGGTSEPSIQLAGGPTARRGDTANQMLATTEGNLKKIAGQQLTSNQQDMVNQIRQFMDQSKSAIGDGDLERARTLAWKAQLLSEELAKPPE